MDPRKGKQTQETLFRVSGCRWTTDAKPLPYILTYHLLASCIEEFDNLINLDYNILFTKACDVS